MNDTKVITPNFTVIGERILETNETIILKTETGRLSIDKNSTTQIVPYIDPAGFAQGSIFKVGTIYGQAAYLKTTENRWVLVWQSVKDANENQVQSDAFMDNATVLTFDELLALYSEA